MVNNILKPMYSLLVMIKNSLILQSPTILIRVCKWLNYTNGTIMLVCLDVCSARRCDLDSYVRVSGL